jgi:hypothetical protein
MAILVALRIATFLLLQVKMGPKQTAYSQPHAWDPGACSIARFHLLHRRLDGVAGLVVFGPALAFPVLRMEV